MTRKPLRMLALLTMVLSALILWTSCDAPTPSPQETQRPHNSQANIQNGDTNSQSTNQETEPMDPESNQVTDATDPTPTLPESESVISVPGLEFVLLDDGTYGVKMDASLCPKEVTIPAQYQGKEVTQLLEKSFSDATNLTRIFIPEGIISIGNLAFSNCTNLTEVSIPSSLEQLGDSVFFKCNRLTYYEVDSVQYLGNEDNPALLLVDVTDHDIQTFDFDPNTKFIYDLAFKECLDLTRIDIPSNIISIGANAFYYIRLTEVTIADGVRYIGDRAFESNKQLTQLTIPGSVKSTGNYAFMECGQLQSVVLQDGVTEIGGASFEGCERLTEIIIPNTLTEISSRAFFGCSSLNNIQIPDSIQFVGAHAFYNCRSLPTTRIDDATYLGNDNTPYLILMKASMTADFSPANGTKIIYDNAFESNHRVIELILPNTITCIGQEAFSGCSKLKSIVIPDSVTHIGFSILKECHSFTDIYYTGSQEQWESMDIYWVINDELSHAAIHYNYTPD